MSRLEKIKAYMELCDIKSQRELINEGGYHKSAPFLSGVMKGEKNLSNEEEKLLYLCINRARAKRIMGYEESKNTTEINE